MFKFKKKNQYKLAVEVSDRFVKWALNSPEGIVEINALDWPEGDESSKKKVSQYLAQMAKKYRLEAQQVVSSIPRYQVTVRNLELPSTKPEEIKKIVELQAVKQTPYTADEIIFDYYVLDSHREDYSNVMLVVSHRQVANANLLFLKEAGLSGRYITLGTTLSPLWLSRSVEEINQGKVVAVLDVDISHTDFFVCKGQQMIFSQHFSVTSDKLFQEPETWRGKIVADLIRAIQIYKSEDVDKEPSVLVIAGALEHLRPAMDRMRSATGLPIKEALMPDKILEAFPRGEAKKTGRFSFSSVLGLCYLQKPLPVSLTLQETVVKASLVEKSRRLLILGELLFSLFVVVLAFFSLEYYQKQKYFSWLEQQTISTQAETEAVLAKRQRLRNIIALNEDASQLFSELAHVVQTVPQAVILSDLSVNAERRLVIQGRAESISHVFDFTNGLKNNPLFKDVDNKRMTKRITNNKEVVDFEIECRLHVPPSLFLEAKKR